MKPLRIALLLALIAVLAAAGFAYYPPFRILTLVVAGRSQHCTLRAALNGPRDLEQQVEFKDRILNASNLIQQDPLGFHLWQTPRGRFWVPEGSDYLLPFSLAEQERRIYGTGQNGPRSGDVVLDCGANVGVTVRMELEAGARQIIAIEPGPENVACLRRNFPDEVASGRVVIVAKGVWDHDDMLTLRVNPKNSSSDSFINRRAGTVDLAQVPLITIDHLVSALNLTKVDYIKMDIEGSEVLALQGAHEVLAKFKPRISVSSDNAPNQPRDIPRVVRAARPDYIMECGPCSQTSRGVQPDVLYFH